MKQLGIAFTLALALLPAGCGSGNMMVSSPTAKSNNVNGAWNTTLTGAKDVPSFALMLMLNQNSDNTVSVTSLNFMSDTPCFMQGSTAANGGFTMSGDPNGMTNGSLALVIQAMPDSMAGMMSTNMSSMSTNMLTLHGTVNNNTATGTFTLTGPMAGCTGSGTLMMQR
jgi:hypothetical protein